MSGNGAVRIIGEVVEDVRPDYYYVGTETAFIHRFILTSNIAYYDFNAIHDRALTYLNSFKDSADAKLYPEFKEFINTWNGGMSISSESTANSIKHLEVNREELSNLLSTLSKELLDMDMCAVVSMEEERKNNNALWFESRECYNSNYRYYDISITAREWLEDRLSKIDAELALLKRFVGKTQAEMDDLYSFNEEDYQMMYDIFSKPEVKDKDLRDALILVSAHLASATPKQIRAYLHIVLSIMSAWIGGLELKYWYKVVTANHKFWRKEQRSFNPDVEAEAE